MEAVPANAPKVDKQRRGRDFERFLKSLLHADGLDPRASYKPDGEEIDGSFLMDGRVYLLEAKWHKEPLPASSIYAFKGKVDGKLLGTIGVFISVSGYSENAVDALTLGKALNLILFDGDDIRAALEAENGFRLIMLDKLRAAAEGGLIYLPARSIQVSAVGPGPDGGNVVTLSEEVETDSVRVGETTSIVVLCEGRSDEIVLSELTRRIFDAEQIQGSVRFIVANGKLALPRLANAVRSIISDPVYLMVIADSDGDPASTFQLLTNDVSEPINSVIIVHPALDEAWLNSDHHAEPSNIIRKSPGNRITDLRRLAGTIPLEELRVRDDAFAQYYTALLTVLNRT